MSNQSILRITKELSDLQKSSDLSLMAACKDENLLNLKALIIGPPDTPYEFGFFEFDTHFDQEYPGKAPMVQSITTNNNTCRFNPNIYSCRKVCLSILGTWTGERGEQWSSAQGLESVLISIQSLMSSSPYENEPGFENANTPRDQVLKQNYISKIRHESLRITVIQRLEQYLGISPLSHRLSNLPQTVEDVQVREDDRERNIARANHKFEPFKDICKRKFLWYYDSYMQAIAKARLKVRDGLAFSRMPFEHQGNEMSGTFYYSELERRLKFIRKVIGEETNRWATEGIILFQNEASAAMNLQRQYEQVIKFYRSNNDITLDVNLVDSNPFVWLLTYFGMPMTNLDGGLFRIKICFSPRFPEEQPRVAFETELFHHRITSDGTPCYFPGCAEDVKSHIQAIIAALNDESLAYDPRKIGNPQAARLLWGSAEDKRLYYRRLRRSVQDTLG